MAVPQSGFARKSATISTVMSFRLSFRTLEPVIFNRQVLFAVKETEFDAGPSAPPKVDRFIMSKMTSNDIHIEGVCICQIKKGVNESFESHGNKPCDTPLKMTNTWMSLANT